MKWVKLVEYVPYCEFISKNPTAYKVMLLHDQEGLTYAQIGRRIGKSTAAASAIYQEVKSQQIQLYYACIAHETGASAVEMQEEHNRAYHCYYDNDYIAAYLEKKYTAILKRYRAGEPGMPQEFFR